MIKDIKTTILIHNVIEYEDELQVAMRVTVDIEVVVIVDGLKLNVKYVKKKRGSRPLEPSRESMRERVSEGVIGPTNKVSVDGRSPLNSKDMSVFSTLEKKIE